MVKWFIIFLKGCNRPNVILNALTLSLNDCWGDQVQTDGHWKRGLRHEHQLYLKESVMNSNWDNVLHVTAANEF